jgi:hypothetical protein
VSKLTFKNDTAGPLSAFTQQHPDLEAYFFYQRAGGETTDTAKAGF